MKVKQIMFLALVINDTIALAQEFPLGVRAQALSAASVAKGRDAEALFANPALLAGIPGLSFTAFYSHPFGIKELRLSSFSTSASLASLALGAAVVDFGNALYRDRWYHLAISRNVLPKRRLALGLGAMLRHLRIAGYGDDSAMLLNLGTQLRLSELLTLGSAISNFLNATIGQQQEKLPRSACLGFAYAPTATLTLQTEVYKQNNFPEEWRLGIEANPLAPLLLRTGIGTNPDRLTFGLALRLLKINLQFAAFSHTDLGWTQQFAVTFMSR
ncbi:MAG: hypothetical protein ACREOI_13745 [bacterium]